MLKKSILTAIAVILALVAVPALKSEAVVRPASYVVVDPSLPEVPVVYGKDVTYSTTIDKINSLDLAEMFSTGSKGMMTLEELVADTEARGGVFVGKATGMPYDEYEYAMNYKWADVTQYNRRTVEVNIDVAGAYTYARIEDILKKLSRYDGVYLYDIGTSLQGRTMYAVEIDIPSEYEKQTMVFTGTVHARETAGTQYLIKILSELVQSKDKETIEFLKHWRVACVPCVNPDVREGVAFETAKYTYSDGQLWKAAANGTDINRNFPGLSWGFSRDWEHVTWARSSSANSLYYIGDYAGSLPEVKALMKFLYYYIGVEKAATLVDWHQQGGGAYAGKDWAPSEMDQGCRNLAKAVFEKMNEGNGHQYYLIPDDYPSYGVQGTGSTLTDFACAIAWGAKFSPRYGFCVYEIDGEEIPLISLYQRTGEENIKCVNPDFIEFCYEIGPGRQYLGYSQKTRKLLKEEFENYRFGNVPFYIAEYIKSLN